MTIAELCASCFHPEIWSRGVILHHQGKVTLSLVDDTLVIATVRPLAGAPVDIGLKFDLSTPKIEAVCGCQDYGMGRLCHHIWATVLAADEAGWLQNILPLLGELTVRHQANDIGRPPPAATDEHKGLRSLFGTSRTMERHRVISLPHRDRRPPVKKAPTWQAQLLRIIQQSTRRQDRTPHGPATAQPRLRQAWYVCNVAKSLQAGGLFLEYYHREHRQNGSFGNIKPQGVAYEDMTLYADPADQRLLQLLLGHKSDEGSATYLRYSRRDPARKSSCVVAPILYDSLLPELCATGRLIWVRDTTTPLDETRTVEWDSEEPWQFKLRMDADDPRRSWRLQGQLVRGDHAVPLSDPLLLLADGLVLFPKYVSRLATSEDFGWIATLRQASELRIPYADRDAFLQLWWSAPALPKADLPPDVDLPAELGVPTGTLTVFTPPPRVQDNHLHANVAVRYGDHQIDPETAQAGIVDLENQLVIRRDGAAEAALLAQLSDLGVRPNNTYNTDADYRFAPRQLPAITDALLQSGWVVEADGVRLRPAGTMTFEVTSGVDWFELDGQVDFGGLTIGLPALLKALRSGDRYVLLDDGSHGMLPETWLARYGKFADLGESSGETIRFKPSQALFLDALLAEQD